MNIYDVYKNPVGKIYATTTGIDVMSAIVTAVEAGSKTPNYLCFTAEEAGSTISMVFHNVIDEEKPVLYISRDKENWERWNYEITLTNVGDKVYMYGTNDGFAKDDESYCAFTMTGKIAASGNIQTLLSEDGSRKSVSEYCYYSLFEECESLTTAPELPATELATDCYDYMFGGCTSLTTAPELPATELAESCYYSMFMNCTSLTTAPELPATTLATECYSFMFFGCRSLTTAPSILPATELADSCYDSMFVSCTSLATAPELPATVLADSCYKRMFAGCTSLTTVPSALPADVLTDNCYYAMFSGCTSLTTAPELYATELSYQCCGSMFNGCTNLNSITMYASDWNKTYTFEWVGGVSPTGTFTCPAESNIPTGSENGIPEGWTRVDL